MWLHATFFCRLCIHQIPFLISTYIYRKKKNRANIVFTMPLCKSQTFSMCYIFYAVLNQLSTTNFRKSKVTLIKGGIVL